MLSLVRSQQACIERIRSAVRWAKRLVVLVGAPGQGKTVVIQDLVLRTPTIPLCLEGELISDRTDAVLRLMGLVGLRPEGSIHEMLARLQSKHSSGSEQGISEIIVDDAHCLPDDVLRREALLQHALLDRDHDVGDLSLVPHAREGVANDRDRHRHEDNS